MIDLHCHIIPQVDDGSPSEAVSLAMARAAAAGGVAAVVCTPHMEAGYRTREDLARMDAARLRLQELLDGEGIALTLLPGAEWLLTPELPEVVAAGAGRLGGGSSRAFLFELSPYMQPGLADAFVSEAVRGAGLVPVLAHPERHGAVNAGNARALLGRLVERGAVMQVTAGSLTGMFGKRVQGTAEAIALAFADRLVLASDAHDDRVRVPGLAAGYAALERCIGPEATEAARQRAWKLAGLEGGDGPDGGDGTA